MGKQVKAKKATRKKAAPKSKGLGDSIEKFTKKTGIKKVVDKCLNDEEYNWLDVFYKSRRPTLTYEEQTKMVAIHNRVLASRRQVSSCGSCVREMVNVMKQLYREYKK